MASSRRCQCLLGTTSCVSSGLVSECVTCILIFRYVGNLQRIYDYSPLDPSQDFATQM